MEHHAGTQARCKGTRSKGSMKMTKLEQIYEGKAKKVFRTDDPAYCVVEYKDDATAFNGLKKGTILGKGAVNNRMTNLLMQMLEQQGIPTHFVKELSDRETVVKRVEIVPLEVIVRNISAGHFAQNYGVEEGIVFDEPTIEFSYKNDGFKGVLGGEYNFNRTEASIWKRFWLPASWGKIDCSVKAGAEWNVVPFPLLILPEANLSYITQRETFSLINNMEFLNDRYASMSLSYDMNGKLFNRIPLIKNLKWREMFRIRALWGTLTDKNNPFKSSNPDLFRFPTRDGKFTSFVMDPKVPYIEGSIGIYNIFKLLHVEYVHRFTYRDNPGINKNGIRFMVLMVF